MEPSKDYGTFIELAVAKTMVKDYQNDPNPNPELIIRSHYFGKNKLLEVLEQNNVFGARIYHGKGANEDGKMVQKIIVVGVDAENNDILNTKKILDFSKPCPTECPPKKGLYDN